MKYNGNKYDHHFLTVAPFTGAWIEIDVELDLMSKELVAPFTGAWIEIRDGGHNWETIKVAPFTGAWIEI